LKSAVRVLGVDDAPFLFGAGKVLVIGAVLRLPNYLEGVMRSDADEALEGMLLRSRFREQLKLVLIDGAALGGFNVVDIDRLHAATGIPMATVTRDPPDLERIGSALRKHFPDWERRLEVISRKRLREVRTEHKPLLVSSIGMEDHEADILISRSIVRGAVPEPLRVAHIIASAMARGESRGRA
jgi:endonuclease V-like protein UPF0215 family